MKWRLLGTDLEGLKSLVATLASWMPAQPRRAAYSQEDPMDRQDRLPRLLNRLLDLLHDILQLPNAQVIHNSLRLNDAQFTMQNLQCRAFFQTYANHIQPCRLPHWNASPPAAAQVPGRRLAPFHPRASVVSGDGLALSARVVSAIGSASNGDERVWVYQ